MATLKLSVHNRNRKPQKFLALSAGQPSQFDTRFNTPGRAVEIERVDGDAQDPTPDTNDPYRVFFLPSTTDLQVGDAPRVSNFLVHADPDLTASKGDLTLAVELTHLPPEAPPTADEISPAPEEPEEPS